MQDELPETSARRRFVAERQMVVTTYPEATALARDLFASGMGMPLRRIGAALKGAGHLNNSGQPFTARIVALMLANPGN